MGPNVGLKPTRSTIRLVQPPLRNPPKQGKKAGVLAAFEDVTPHPPKRDVLHNLLPQPSKTFGPCIHYTDWAASQPVARADFLCGHLRTPQGRPRCLAPPVSPPHCTTAAPFDCCHCTDGFRWAQPLLNRPSHAPLQPCGDSSNMYTLLSPTAQRCRTSGIN
jgi:hypothetical protein